MARDAKLLSQTALQIEQEVVVNLTKALEHGRKAKNHFDSTGVAAEKFSRNYAHISQLAQQRESAIRIAEENQRTVVNSAAEIIGLLATIHSLRHDKFAPGGLPQFAGDIDEFQRTLAAGEFASAVPLGKNLCGRLREVALAADIQDKRLVIPERLKGLNAIHLGLE